MRGRSEPTPLPRLASNPLSFPQKASRLAQGTRRNRNELGVKEGRGVEYTEMKEERRENIRGVRGRKGEKGEKERGGERGGEREPCRRCC